MQNNKTILENLLKEIGLDSPIRNHYKKLDQGLLQSNQQSYILEREGYSQAEKCFLDPQVSTCFLLSVFEIMCKKVVFEPNIQGKKSEIKKSREMSDFLNFTLKKIKNGGIKQLQFDLMLAKFFGFSLIEKVYGNFDIDQSSKYQNYYYYSNLKSKRTGIWDFVYDDYQNIIGFKSLLQKDIIYPLDKFLYLSYLPKYNNPNGTPDFDKVWKFWDAKTEFIISSATLGMRLSKGKQIFLKGTNNGAYDKSEIKEVLKNISDNLSVYIPIGYEIILNDLNTSVLNDYQSMIKYFNSEIAIALLGASTSVNESQGAGTNAQSKVHMENQKSFQEYSEGIFCDCMEEQYAHNLLKLNFDYPEEYYPKCSLISEKKEPAIDRLNKFKLLKELGVMDFNTQIDLDIVRQDSELPENPELNLLIDNSPDSNENDISGEDSISKFYSK